MQYTFFVGWFLLLICLLVVSWSYSTFYRPVVIQRLTYQLFAIRDQNRRQRIAGKISEQEFSVIEDRANVAITIIDVFDVAMVMTIYRRLEKAGRLNVKAAEKDAQETRYIAEMSDRMWGLTMQAALYNSHGIGLVFTILRKFDYLKKCVTKTTFAYKLRTMNDGVLDNTSLSLAERLHQQIRFSRHFDGAT